MIVLQDMTGRLTCASRSRNAPALVTPDNFTIAEINRSLGMSISYNVSVTTGGGFAQMIFVMLIHSTGSIAAPSYYVVAAGIVGMGSLLICTRLRQIAH